MSSTRREETKKPNVLILETKHYNSKTHYYASKNFGDILIGEVYILEFV